MPCVTLNIIVNLAFSLLDWRVSQFSQLLEQTGDHARITVQAVLAKACHLTLNYLTVFHLVFLMGWPHCACILYKYGRTRVLKACSLTCSGNLLRFLFTDPSALLALAVMLVTCWFQFKLCDSSTPRYGWLPTVSSSLPSIVYWCWLGWLGLGLVRVPFPWDSQCFTFSHIGWHRPFRCPMCQLVQIVLQI